MAILIDSNVLLRSLHPGHAHYALAENAISKLRLGNETLCIAPQNLVEFWAVSTRPRNDSGLGLTVARAATEMANLRRLFRLLPYSPDVLEAWQRIVIAHGITGKQTHDAHLVAIMQAYAVTNVLTFDVRHFSRFPGIRVLDPAHI
jgi:predicted nucleic acid-binding protein